MLHMDISFTLIHKSAFCSHFIFLSALLGALEVLNA